MLTFLLILNKSYNQIKKVKKLYMLSKEFNIIGNILGIVLILIIYLIGTIHSLVWSQLLIPIIAAMSIGLYMRITTFMNLKILNELEYEQYDLKNNPIVGKDMIVEYSWKNIFRTSPFLYLKQESKGKGDWESYMPISSLNPYSSTGIYNYSSSGVGKGGLVRGGHKGDWGSHSIVINPEINVIHVSAIGKNRSAQDEYVIKPKYSRKDI